MSLQCKQYETSFGRVHRQFVEAIIFEQLLAIEEEISVFLIYGKSKVYRYEGKRTAFDRVRLYSSVFCDQNDGFHLQHISELMDELVVNSEEATRLVEDLVQTVTLLEWNEIHSPIPFSRRASSYEELESEIQEGHTYHPFFKTRRGFSLEDHKRYGPESKYSFSLLWAAVKKEYLSASGIDDFMNFWVEHIGYKRVQSFMKTLTNFGLSSHEYTLLPIHPYQWKSLQSTLTQQFNLGDFIILGYGNECMRASQSIRSTWSEKNKKSSWVKFSLNMSQTSSLRTMKPEGVLAAPALSKWISQCILRDHYLHQEANMRILKEYAGLSLLGHNENRDVAEQFSVLFRESFHSSLSGMERAVPFTALMQLEQDGKPFIDEWIERYGVEQWVHRFLDQCIIPIVHLLVVHGIALEAHAQNMILVHEEGWPKRVIVRDFHESVEYVEEFVKDPKNIPNFASLHPNFEEAEVNEWYWMSSLKALKELLLDTVFVYHLSELSYLLEELYGFEERSFYSLLRVKIIHHFKQQTDWIDRLEQLDLFSKDIDAESLLRKKLCNIESTHKIKNSLSQEWTKEVRDVLYQ